MTHRIDAHHHLWDLSAVHYPWLMEAGATRFFGDPAPIRRDFLLRDLRADAGPRGIGASVHIQVGAQDPVAEAEWIQSVADENPDWEMAQVVFCDLTAPDLDARLAHFNTLSTVRGVRQIIGRAPGEDMASGTNALLDDPRFLDGLRQLPGYGLSFDLQLLPELMDRAAAVFAEAPDTGVALCHAGSPHDRSEKGLLRWAEALRCLSRQPHITCKLSGLGMFDHDWTTPGIAPIVDTCLDQFGPGRCMFGSNFPVDSLSSGYGDLIDAYEALIPDSHHGTVFSETAARFYRMAGR